MYISQDQFRLARLKLVSRPRSIDRIDWPDFKVRPISEEWQYVGRVPAYKTAVANVAYIWRDCAPRDRFGPMLARFAVWYVMMEIPLNVRREHWRWLVAGFLQNQLVGKRAAVAWAAHAVEGDDGAWIIKPHVHVIATARHWRHDKRHGQRHGQRHPNWISSWGQQKRMEFAWRRRCTGLRDIARMGFLANGCWASLPR